VVARSTMMAFTFCSYLGTGSTSALRCLFRYTFCTVEVSVNILVTTRNVNVQQGPCTVNNEIILDLLASTLYIRKRVQFRMYYGRFLS
jgi:hypothetical protein